MKRKRRLYLQYVENSLVSIKSAIDAFNRVYDKHKIGTTLILLTKAWEPRSTNFVGKCADILNLKGNMEYHQAIRSSRSGRVQKYSQKAFKYLKNYLEKNPNFNPYKKSKEK